MLIYFLVELKSRLHLELEHHQLARQEQKHQELVH
jgi:hypothetical protein